ANDGYTVDEAEELALKYLNGQMSADGEASTTGSTVVATETAGAGSAKSFHVVVNAKHTVKYSAFTRMFGYDEQTLSANSEAQSATESKNALSMFLVLDRSGSMAWITDEVESESTRCQNHSASNWYTENLRKTKPCYRSKISSLKIAVANLTSQLDESDPGNEFVRTAAVSYNDAQQSPTSLAWGTDDASAYVAAFPTVPTGGTDSSSAFKVAYQAVVADAETTEHERKNGQVPTRYIVFMTDGENTSYNGYSYSGYGDLADTETKKWCDKARDEDEEIQVEVYTVAFMAPTRGKQLLEYCATSGDHYIEATNNDELVAAFKYIGERASAVVSRLSK
ncbi:VWA domain-containing protein, partial [Rhizobium sp. TRM95111]|uniref:vWA domain-containing protein n=1 Tax=Rhizobium alarense TaxID=2846851 RepID=UPI001F332665